MVLLFLSLVPYALIILLSIKHSKKWVYYLAQFFPFMFIARMCTLFAIVINDKLEIDNQVTAREKFVNFSSKRIESLQVFVDPVTLPISTGHFTWYWVTEIIIFFIAVTYYSVAGRKGLMRLNEKILESQSMDADQAA